jgi:hypothetical protein
LLNFYTNKLEKGILMLWDLIVGGLELPFLDGQCT